MFQDNFDGKIQEAYQNLYPLMTHDALYSINEVSTDEMVITQKGGDWFDGGVWIRMHRHEYNSNETAFLNAWNFCYLGIVRCNELLFQFERGGPGLETYIAELKSLRALFYFWLLDNYGTIPVVTDFLALQPSDIENVIVPGVVTRDSLYSFIETELIANMQNLSTAMDASTYGRFTKWAGHTLLAKLYLNAEVYTGVPQWSLADIHCDSVINSGLFSLEGNFLDAFAADNEMSTEHIFAIPYDQDTAQGFNIGQMTLHPSSQATFNLQEQPWNGYASLQEFYESFEPSDARKNGFLEGPQFESDGITPITDPAFDGDPDGPEIDYTPEINELEPNSYRQAGVRIGKWEYEDGATSNLNNDFALFRYADILMMKSEALLNLEDTIGSLSLFNQIRTRAGVATLTPLDYNADTVLAERGREFLAEGWRRQDLIRFGRYNDAWEFKNVSGPQVNVFPIPNVLFEGNPNLIQNPGY
jgi:hypothetical protein